MVGMPDDLFIYLSVMWGLFGVLPGGKNEKLYNNLVA